MAKSVPMMQNYFSSGIFSSVDSEDMHINNNDIMIFSVLGFRSDIRIELQTPVARQSSQVSAVRIRAYSPGGQANKFY